MTDTLVVMCFHVSGHSHWTRSDTRGLKSESDQWTDGAVSNNFDRQRRDRSRKNSRESGHAHKTVLADLSQKKSRAATWTVKPDMRCGYTGSGLHTDASEPQHTSVISFSGLAPARSRDHLRIEAEIIFALKIELSFVTTQL